MKVICTVAVFVFLFVTTGGFSQSVSSLLNEGNRAYASNDFKRAQNLYEQSIALGARQQYPEVLFNLGNALYQQEKYEDAEEQYVSFLKNELTPEWKARAHYNLGNCYLAMKKLPSAIDSYKQVLKLNPKDEDARYNLLFAMNLQQGNQPSQPQSSSEKKDSQMPTVPPLSQEDQRKLLDQLTQEETKTIQQANQNQSSSGKKIIRDW